MADLKEMTERVVEKEEEAIRQDVEKKRNNAEEEIQDARKKSEEQKIEGKKSIEDEANRQYSISKNTLEIQQRNEILAAKQDIISRLLNNTKEELKQIDEGPLKNFTSDVLKQFEGEGQVELILGEYTQDKINQGWLNNLSLQNLQVELSNEFVKNQAGIVVKKGGIEYNFLFDELVGEIRREIVPKITEELFN